MEPFPKSTVRAGMDCPIARPVRRPCSVDHKLRRRLILFGALTVRSAIGAKKGSPTGPPLSRNGAVSRCSAAPDAWVQRVAQPVTDIVHRQNCHRDGNTGKQDAFGEFLHPYHGVSQHFAPCRKVRGEAYAKE